MSTLITFQISEAATQCRLEVEEILHFIDCDWIIPVDRKKLLFDEDDIARIHLIAELKVKLGVNNEGVPIILHLIDQLNHLHLYLKIPKEY